MLIILKMNHEKTNPTRSRQTTWPKMVESKPIHSWCQQPSFKRGRAACEDRARNNHNDVVATGHEGSKKGSETVMSRPLPTQKAQQIIIDALRTDMPISHRGNLVTSINHPRKEPLWNKPTAGHHGGFQSLRSPTNAKILAAPASSPLVSGEDSATSTITSPARSRSIAASN